MNELRPIDTILITAVVCIAIGQVYVLFSLSEKGTSEEAGVQITSNEKDVIGLVPSTALMPIGGEAQEIEGETIILKSENTSVKRIIIRSSTAIVSQGAQKDDATYAKDMEEFRQHSFDLAQDPEKNHDALARLLAPSPFIETVISLNEIKAGDLVTAYMDSGGAAAKVIIVRK